MLCMLFIGLKFCCQLSGSSMQSCLVYLDASIDWKNAP